MKLVELISGIAEDNELKFLLKREGVVSDSEHLSVYITPDLKADSEVKIFGIEQTEEAVHYVYNGTEFIQLFPLSTVIEVVEGGLEAKIFTHREIADRLIEYQINDA
ncbi:hypothetical protein LRS06_08610 [Hymenobacter sp. J193]|uniref:hypothetical protein n=1 Tax=Hymenobacter sp. J193 TaxID=2898429 RepID=UPI002150A6A5|nr:hypothetical protein [Hymenobacter sp. J193]MCR5887838.1 hypothetical protein [Hymenobacter sp. J193]